MHRCMDSFLLFTIQVQFTVAVVRMGRGIQKHMGAVDHAVLVVFNRAMELLIIVGAESLVWFFLAVGRPEMQKLRPLPTLFTAVRTSLSL